MASGKTEHLGLSQWSADDRIAREDFNADNRIIDAALAGLGGLRVGTGTYTGNGQAEPLSLTFDGRPLVVLIAGYDSSLLLMARNAYQGIVLRGSTPLSVGVEWSADGARWTWIVSGSYQTSYMMNRNGTVYTYYALLAD